MRLFVSSSLFVLLFLSGCKSTTNSSADGAIQMQDAAVGDAVIDDAADAASDAATDAASNMCSGAANGASCNGNGISLCCGGACTDVTRDPNNCNECGHRCGGNEGCVAGQCLPVDCSALVDNTQCGIPSHGLYGRCCTGQCIADNDFDTDNANCGTCGNACSPGTMCSSGHCPTPVVCGSGNSGAACGISDGGVGTCCGDACVDDLMTNPDHCAACGNVCPTGVACMNGQCWRPADAGVPTCPEGSMLTNTGACVVLRCAPGVSGVACAFTDDGVLGIYSDVMDGQCCNGACTNPAQDPNNCGTCGTTCASGVCTTQGLGSPGLPSGVCLPVPMASPADAGVDCLWATDRLGIGGCLPTNCDHAFAFAACAVGTAVGLCCDEGFGGTRCVDALTDNLNCGGCNIHCPDSQTCVNGVCSGASGTCNAQGRVHSFCDVESSATSMCCPGTGCANLANDPQNCAACGNSCEALDCVNGHCEAASCTSRENGVVCGVDHANQCCGESCADTNNDANNCGSCGARCPGGETCTFGHCGFAMCTPSTHGDACHLDSADAGVHGQGMCCSSGCVDTQNDAMNCGGCDLGCGSGGTCVNGACH